MNPTQQPPPRFEDSPLPDAMRAVANADTPANRHTLYRALLESWFLVPTREEPKDAPGFHDLHDNVAASFSLETDGDGKRVLPVFTDEEALHNWNQGIAWIALQGAGFFQAVAGTEVEDVVINPYEPENANSKMIRPGGRVTRWEFELLAQGVDPQDTIEGKPYLRHSKKQS